MTTIICIITLQYIHVIQTKKNIMANTYILILFQHKAEDYSETCKSL